MALPLRLAASAARYLSRLDQPTQKRIKEKITAISKDPTNIRLSKPLTSSFKRSAQVGTYRLLLLIEDESLIISDIGPRGQIYRKA